jgi:ferrous iron transport protein A
MAASLNQVKTGEKVKITSLGQGHHKEKLLSLGLLPGDEIEVLSRAPLGSPISFCHGQSHFFAMRTHEAKNVLVEKIEC